MQVTCMAQEARGLQDRMVEVAHERDQLSNVLQQEREAWRAEREELAADRAAETGGPTSAELQQVWQRQRTSEEVVTQLYNKLKQKGE